ncbi:hypothetical protein [Nocardia terpenica]|uniref:hypothetical protein n=1 Tax=Nocardia terpenica TaxID=455432 RepID=UPI000313ABD9|nr:hypothetical protein [Nocardia terpenica]NQE89684.1 hypothetical protein [Nocardia terpenica]
MKRLSATAAALGVLALVLTACGGHDNSSSAASGLRKNAPTSTATRSAAPTTPAAVPSPSPAPGTPASATPAGGATQPTSQTICRDFKAMDADAEKTVVEKVLADNPGSKLDGNPSLALGTAKLVCLASSEADVPVAVAIGVTPK